MPLRSIGEAKKAIPLFDSIIPQILRLLASKLRRGDKLFNSPAYKKLSCSRTELASNIRLKYIENELELIRYYKFLLDLYDNKFKGLIPKLREVISKIYKKKVEFNIVSLKHMYLNSDILSQAVALKLKNRDNRL